MAAIVDPIDYSWWLATTIPNWAFVSIAAIALTTIFSIIVMSQWLDEISLEKEFWKAIAKENEKHLIKEINKNATSSEKSPEIGPT